MSTRAKRERKPVDYTGSLPAPADPPAPVKKSRSKKAKDVPEVLKKNTENGEKVDDISDVPSIEVAAEPLAATSKKRGKKATSDVVLKKKAKQTTENGQIDEVADSNPLPSLKVDDNVAAEPTASKRRGKQATPDVESKTKSKKAKSKDVETKSRKGKVESKENGGQIKSQEDVVEKPKSKTSKKTVSKEKTPVEEIQVESSSIEKESKPKKASRKRSNEVESNGDQGTQESTTKKRGKRVTPEVEVRTKTKAEAKEMPEAEYERAEKPKSRSRRAASVTADSVDEEKKAKGKTSTTDKEPKAKKTSRKRTKEIESNGDQVTEEEPPSSKPDEPKQKKGRVTKKLKPVDEIVEDDQKKVEDEPKAKKGRATKKLKTVEDVQEEVENGEPLTVEEPKSKDKKPKAEKMNATVTKYEEIDFSMSKEYNLKISSWNVAGLRSWLTKDGLKYITHEKPDIFCLQEIKCEPEKLPEESRVSGYHPYWLCQKGGYAGVAIYSKIMPINVEYGIGDSEQDEDGRIITAEYEKFFLICTYVPNSGRGLVTLPKRLRWNTLFKEYVTRLNAIKPVIIAGDMNVSHQEIDLARPQSNKKSAGFTQEERDGMTEFLSTGFIDTFRHLYRDKEGAYTYWTYMANSRSKNVGWRLDYFLVSERIITKIVDNVMRSQVLGSDHCPITLFANM